MNVRELVAKWVAIADGEGADVRLIFDAEPHQAFHDFMCVCGLAWKECTTDGMSQDIAKIDDPDEWTLDEAGRQFSAHWEHECGKVSLYRVWEAALANAAPDAGAPAASGREGALFLKARLRQKLRELMFPKIVDDALITEWMWADIERFTEALSAMAATPRPDPPAASGLPPDDWSPGDVIAAGHDGTIILDDGITTFNRIRAKDFLAGSQAGELRGRSLAAAPRPELAPREPVEREVMAVAVIRDAAETCERSGNKVLAGTLRVCASEVEQMLEAKPEREARPELATASPDLWNMWVRNLETGQIFPATERDVAQGVSKGWVLEHSKVRPDKAKRHKKITPENLADAWKRYVWLFEEVPHGTRKQMAALLALIRDETKGTVEIQSGAEREAPPDLAGALERLADSIIEEFFESYKGREAKDFRHAARRTLKPILLKALAQLKVQR